MAVDFNRSPRVIDVNPWLRDPQARVKMILEVVERDSVIAGLPPFSDDFRRRLKQDLFELALRNSGDRE